MPARYIDIAQRLARRIQSGEWQPGEKMPSLRELCHLEHVSLMTALSIYSYLEERGFLQARPRSGFVVKPQRVPIHEHPAFEDLNLPEGEDREAIVQAILRRGNAPNWLSFGAGSLDPVLLPVTAMKRLGRQVLHRDPESLMRYSSPPGHLGLRKTLATRLNNRGCSFRPRDLMLTSGCMEALHLSLSHLLKPGDRVLVESPTFFSLFTLLRDIGADVVEVPIDPRFGLQPSMLRDYLRRFSPRLVILIPNFNNPTGALIPEENKETIVHLLEEHGVACLEDDIYAELSFTGDLPRPLLAYARKDHFWLVSSVSKSLAPGVRVGFVASASSIEPLCEMKAARTVSNVAFSENLIAEYFASGLFDRHLRRLTQKLQSSLHRFQRTIAEAFPPTTRVADPDGGFFLWVGLPSGISGTWLFRECMKERIVITPGSIFSGSDLYRTYIRLNCGLEWSQEIEQGLRRIGHLVQTGR